MQYWSLIGLILALSGSPDMDGVRANAFSMDCNIGLESVYGS